MKQVDWKNKVAVSSGGVIYRESQGSVEVAITTKANRRVWCLPKGLVEQGESLEETAIREVAEETGLTGEIESKIDQIDYWFYWKREATRYHKFVHFYLLKYLEGNPEDHDHEVEEVHWVPLPEAAAKLSYDSEREVMKKAQTIIEKQRSS